MLTSILQIVISILLATTILMQGGGSGLGSSFGGGANADSSFRSRRGVEKLLLYFAGILAILFFISSLTNFLG
jgi:protein translocase SecG subunit